MATLLDFRRRIRSVKSSQQITRAMKLVAAAKLRRAQDRALAARPYAQMLSNVLKSLVSRAEIYDPETGEPRHPLLAQRPENRILLIVVTGDKGLAGAFNTNILKAATRFLESKHGKNIEIETVGRKGRDFLKRRFKAAKPREKDSQAAPATTIVREQVGVLQKVEYSFASELAENIIKRYSEQEIDAVYLVYNEFKSVISQRLVVDEMLPIRAVGEIVHEMAEEVSEEERRHRVEAAAHAGVGVRAADTSAIDQRAAGFATAEVDYIYEQPAERLFGDLLPRYISVQLFRAMLESEAAEHAARMTAMDSATNNAGEMIDGLTLAMNRARQAKITREIIEIVSGAAAL